MNTFLTYLTLLNIDPDIVPAVGDRTGAGMTLAVLVRAWDWTRAPTPGMLCTSAVALDGGVHQLNR